MWETNRGEIKKRVLEVLLVPLPVRRISGVGERVTRKVKQQWLRFSINNPCVTYLFRLLLCSTAPVLLKNGSNRCVRPMVSCKA